MRLSRLGPVALLVLLWAAPRTPRTAALTTKGAQLVDEAGSTVELHGLNVAGFHSFLSMASSLSAGFDSLSQDWETVLWRIKALGFNAVRLPFTFASLDQHGTPYGRSGCQAATFEQAVRATTPPNRVQSFGDGNSTSCEWRRSMQHAACMDNPPWLRRVTLRSAPPACSPPPPRVPRPQGRRLQRRHPQRICPRAFPVGGPRCGRCWALRHARFPPGACLRRAGYHHLRP
jgi:hypothetical protein